MSFKTKTFPTIAVDSRSSSGDGAPDAEDLEVANLQLSESASSDQHPDRVKFDLSVVEDAERLNVLVSLKVIDVLVHSNRYSFIYQG